MKCLYMASVGTRHFEFDAFGEDHAGAKAALRRVLEAHAIQYDLTPPLEWVEDVMGDVNVRGVQLGVGYRDGSPVPMESQ